MLVLILDRGRLRILCGWSFFRYFFGWYDGYTLYLENVIFDFRVDFWLVE